MNIVVYIVDGVAEFGLSALLETFATAGSLRTRLPHPPSPWQVRTVSQGDSVRSGRGFVIPTLPFDEIPWGQGDSGAVDMLIVPAVGVGEPEPLIELITAAESAPLLERINRIHAAGGSLAAACTGTFFLAEAGVLDHRSATTTWWLGPAFRRRYPAVHLDEARTLCRSGRIVTAGAALSHLDLALSLIRGHSRALAELTARVMLAGSSRAQADYIVPEMIAEGNSMVVAFERWVREHLGGEIRIATAARDLGVTERTLQRVVQAELGKSPRDFAGDIRLDRATHLLRSGDLSVEEVAAQVGYLNAGTLRNLVRRRRGMSITELRASGAVQPPDVDIDRSGG